MGLQLSWAMTCGHLEKARACMPAPVVQGSGCATLEAYQEFLNHNELELAMEQLAALNMGLARRAAYYETKLSSAE